MEFFESWKALNKRFKEGKLTALTQLVGYKLFAVANELRFPENFLLTDRELQSLTNIKSGRTIVEARRQLKNAGILDFDAKKARPVRYRFTIAQISSKQEVSKIEASGKQEVSKILGCNMPACEDVKTKNNDDCACANADEMDELMEYWEAQGGGRLTFEHQAEIAVWLSEKGLLWLKEAVKTAANANNNLRGMSFNYLKAIVSTRLNETSASSKGESKPATTSADDMLKALEEQIKW